MREDFLRDHPDVTDLIFYESIDPFSLSYDLFDRSNINIDPRYRELPMHSFARVLTHRKIWFECYKLNEDVLVSDINNYDNDVQEILDIDEEQNIVSLSDKYTSYRINHQGCVSLLESNLLSNLVPLEIVLGEFIQSNHNIKIYPKNYKFYVLTSKDLKCLKRHISPEYSNISPKKLVVVINTKDKDYEKKAAEWCEQEGVEYHITKSNGTPSRGKNLMLELFLNSDDDYMVQIDGDDYLTPHGVWLYDHISKLKSPPDAVCLKNQISKVPDWAAIRQQNIVPYSDDAPSLYCQYFTCDWETIKKNSIYEPLISSGVDETTAKKFDKWHKEFYRIQKKYCEDDESHCRVTWLSKKAVKNSNGFPEDLLVGEDTVFYFDLKKKGILGDLDVVCNDERPATYVYDQTTKGTVITEIKEGTDWTWMGKYNKYVKKLAKQGLMVKNKDLPLLKIDYPLNYIPDTLGSSGSVEYSSNEPPLTLVSPANASRKSLLQKVAEMVHEEKHSKGECGCYK